MAISKLCADHLRSIYASAYGQKLKASHAPEIVAAFFGYRSHAAQLADQEYPLFEIEKCCCHGARYALNREVVTTIK